MKINVLKLKIEFLVIIIIDQGRTQERSGGLLLILSLGPENPLETIILLIALPITLCPLYTSLVEVSTVN